MKLRAAIIGAIVILVSLLVWMGVSDPEDFRRIDSASVQDVLVLQDRVLYHTNDGRLKAFDWDSEERETLATIDAHDLQFSPDGQHLSYTQGNAIHIEDTETGETIATLSGNLHTWQSEAGITYLQTDDETDSTFYSTGTLTNYDIETQSDTVIGDTEATRLHATGETGGVIHQAFGEGGETRGRILRYEMRNGRIKEATSDIDILSTSTAPGVFAFMTEVNESVSLIRGNTGVEAFSPPPTQDQYHVLSEDRVLGVRSRDGSTTAYVYDVEQDDSNDIFQVSEVGRPLHVSVSGQRMAVATRHGLYIGGF